MEISHVRPNLPTNFVRNTAPEPLRAIINNPINIYPTKLLNPNIQIPVNKQ
jgi:hypothetical protein